ncbi:mitochondrial biogenesis AIM24-domain-containing protein [Gaertneriomyces semiglobifer]|nr:mitochondrial biogenesis AIM24-domain-containing protein [Gaertneriomyces semiglobifer]
MANIPANSQVFSAKNSALAFSPAVKHTRAVQGSTTEAISSTLKGGALLWDKFSTENAGGDLILAPRRIGDIASLTMDGTAEYYVRRDAFLAGTGTLLVSSSLRGFGLGSGGLFSYRVQGKGAIAISTYGGMFRLVLAPGEEYHVDPRHIVAWNASLQPEPADKSRRAISKTPRRDYGKTLRGLMPTNLSQRIKDMFTTAKSTPAVSTPAPTVEKMGQTSSTETISATTPPVSRKAEDTSAKLLHATGDVSKKMLVATGNIITRMACWVWKTTRQSLYGNQSYYTLRGPGDFYLSSRVEPSFGWLRDVQRKRPLKVSADSNATVTRDIKLPKQ